MPRYEAVVFDLDGTLLDTLEDLTRAINHALRESGYPEHTAQEVRGYVGDGVGMLARRALPRFAEGDEEAQGEVLQAFKAYYAAHNHDFTAPYEGVQDMLRRLRERGVRTAVVSNKNDPNVRALCDIYFKGLIDACVGEREGVPLKPAPDMPLEALKAMGCSADKALYVGDSGVDIATAANAGIACATVSWGFWDTERLRAAGADRLFESAGELADWILK